MQKSNLFYSPEVLYNLGNYLTLKDLLSTATLSKQYHHILKQYVKEHYGLTNQQGINQFQQLKELFNRKIYIYHKGQKWAQPYQKDFIVRNIKAQELYSVVETIQGSHRLIHTGHLILNQPTQMINFPQTFKFCKPTQGGMLYCADGQKLTRFNMNIDPLKTSQTIILKGQVQDIIGGFRFALAVVRDKPESVSLIIFDNNEPIESFKRLQIDFPIAQFTILNNVVLGKSGNYFIFNEVLYEFNIKTGAVGIHPQFNGKRIVRILGGKHHFMAYQKTEEVSECWSTEQVIKFAQREGFEDYIKIFKAQKVTGKILMMMDKRYMEEVLGILNVKQQLKLKIRLEECNKENPDNYVIHGWGRAAEGQLCTNPAKELRPTKIKLPSDCEIFKLEGNYTFLHNRKDRTIVVNTIDEKSNKLEFKEITNRKLWSLSTIDETIILVASAQKEKVPQRESESIVVQKKQKLRTAKNIIDKITWDEHLSKQDFSLGYLDKYDGILQISFSQLQHSQIKQYRIQYFKRGKEVVWDKKKRIDIL